MLQEDVVDPDLPIVDAHHHLWITPKVRYLLDEFVADVSSGHNIVASVYVECSSMYRREGPEHLRSVGEAQFVGGVAAMSDSGVFGPTRICAGFVGAADLCLAPDVLEEALAALDAASAGRMRGIRGVTMWDEDPSIYNGTRGYAPENLMADPGFRRGVRRLGEKGLIYDSLQYFPQLPAVGALADACPDTTFVINHSGGLVGVHRYDSSSTFDWWKANIAEIAKRPNTVMKIGGMSGYRCGFGLERRTVPATSDELAAIWTPYVAHCIEQFGVERCMFESNFSVDAVAGSYRTVWNGLKKTVRGASADEKRALFAATAERIYSLEPSA